MEKYKINRDSWHYKFNTLYLNKIEKEVWEYQVSSFCEYWGEVIAKMLLLLVTFMMIIFVLFVLAITITFAIMEAVAFFTVILGMVAIAAVWYSVGQLLSFWKNKPKNEDEQPSLVKQKYISWKEKFCLMVEYDD